MAVILRTLSTTDSEALEQVRQYFRNYAGWLGVDLSYQNFDQEMASLPGAYSAPEGRLFFAEVDGRPAGCVGIRPLIGSDGVCEMKRLYVTPDERGQGIGAALAMAAIKAAKEIGYRKLMLDTLPNMRMAVKLYRELGFTEAPAYYQTPVEGTMFLALDLENWLEEEIRNENLSHLFDFNRAWARQMREIDPTYFEKLARLQTPELLWIGCSDSRVPANQITGLSPGEVFVHRNIGNVVVQTDLNLLSVLQFAIDLLHVEHVIVCGHYGCSGVRAAMAGERVGVADNWLRQIEAVYSLHDAYMARHERESDRHDRLCELNVLEQVVNVARTTVVRDAWARGQTLAIHGWIYGLQDGLLRDIGPTVSAPGEIVPEYREALARLSQGAETS